MKNCKYSKLDGLITEKYGTRSAFAKALGITPTTLGKKMAGETPWKQREIENSIALLSVEQSETAYYFFNN